ncbi:MULTISPECIES: AMP-binding protein [unclassified Bradyrhizobium]|uniref:class I adenylate-forming enzyme family protein n=1 Tax=unclassified Bradyrhizobium TaxID=2631580 RepID=UPI00247AAFD5|nr:MULTISPECIES: AMP-binding protein [unclassified Bradyrhizobium]WGR70020.1 AMP-binding protein [Bradyrhizobium sp. ISRA426]WGR82077.1 AMP-binding protein [Bradyrhizobium sp. ISRA430]WGR85263.1 AMP-binding protein [Bradyrhizobium sp. ISRA432]
MNLAHHLLRAARADASAPALFKGLTPVADYGRLAATVASLAASMQQRLGLAKGDRVALLMKNVPDYVACLYACWHAGLVAVPINAKLHPREVAFILDNSGAAVVFVTEDMASVASEALALGARKPHVIEIGSAEHRSFEKADGIAIADVGITDPAWIFYTSGTTGRPKGAVLSHRNLLAMALNYLAEINPIAPGESLLHAAPMSHGSGLYMVPHVLGMGAQVVPESGRFEPDEILELTAKRDDISFFAAPTMVRRLTVAAEAAGASAPGLKTIIYGGGPMYVADCKAALAVFGPKLAQIYGQGETPMTITYLPKSMHVDAGHPRHQERLASVGIAQGVVQVRTVDEAGRDVAPGEIGEIIVRGDTVMSGYWQNPEATANTLRDGWLYTGDMGAFDADGFLTLKDRSKDVIISGGTNIYPREVEEVLLRHEAVAEVSVIGRPHPEWGEEVVAVVVPVTGKSVTRSELDQICNAWIARFKRPKHYYVTGELPKNSYGKIVKTELRTLLNESSARLAPMD